MELTGIKETGLALVYIRDAITELAINTGGDVGRETYSIVADQREYDLPDDFGAVKRVFQYNSSHDTYTPLPEIAIVDIIEDES